MSKLSVIAAGGAAALLLTACGSSGGNPSGNSSPPPVTDSSSSQSSSPSMSDMGSMSMASQAPSSASPESSSESSSQASSGSTSSGTTVEVKDYKFTPSTITVKKGQKVTWKFGDDTAHNVTADDKSFASDNVSNGGTYSHVFNTVGSYSYVCTIHPYMKGTVKVTG